MFKFLTIIALIASIGQSDASAWQRLREGVAGVAGTLVGRSIIHIKNNSGYDIRVGTSREGQGFIERVGTLLDAGFNGGYDLIRPGGSADYETRKDNGFFTVGAQYHKGKDPLFTYCKLDTSKASHTLVFRADGSPLGSFVGSLTKHLKCHDETR